MADPSPDTNTPKILESPEEVLSTMSRDGKRRWLYPILEQGRMYWARLAVAWGLIALFVALPLIPVSGKPAVLLDFIHREFTLFGTTFYPTDTVLLMILGIGILVTVVLFTALLGRVWCGWGCPQTVYMEYVFRPLERLIEGKPNKHRRRDEGPWTNEKATRKTIKHIVFVIVSVLMSHVFLAYFVGWSALTGWMTQSPDAHWGFFVAMAFVSVLIYVDFAYFREQMCTITCPYARIQSVLLDRDSLIVSYDPNRGEPRGKRKKTVEGNLGDCIDCNACVRCCPTGIDIRNGLQMECITCTQCIDACDRVMDKIGKPRGLIRYTSENALDTSPSSPKARILRPRLILYVIPLVIVVTAFVWIAVEKGGGLEVDVGRVAGAPFAVLPDGQVTNRLRFRLRNRTNEPTSVHLAVVEPEGAEIKVIGEQTIALEPGKRERIETFVVASPDAFHNGSSPTMIRVTNNEGLEEIVEFTLLGPSRK